MTPIRYKLYSLLKKLFSDWLCDDIKNNNCHCKFCIDIERRKKRIEAEFF